MRRSTLALVTALLLAACGSDSEEGGSAADSPASEPAAQQIQKDPANASKGTITVGSKNFTEQYILGEIYAQTLEAAGFKVKKRLNLGSEQIAYKALKSGQIDAYPEYTGTALTSFFDVKTADVPKEPDAAYEQVKAEYKKEKITALPRTPFENTFRIASTVETAKKAGNPKTFSELVAKAPNLSVSGFPECRQRTDCLLGLKETYGYKGKFVSSEGKYNDLDQGTSDLTFGFSTDAQLALKDKYVGYEDDKKLFPPYNISFGVRDDAIKKIGPRRKRRWSTSRRAFPRRPCASSTAAWSSRSRSPRTSLRPTSRSPATSSRSFAGASCPGRLGLDTAAGRLRRRT
jgi:glycine betaine/choline ABC-type transport system substrate-binding protein